MLSPHEQVHTLLQDMKLAAKGRDFSKLETLSDQMEVLTTAYMVPTVPESWPGFHFPKYELRLLDCLKAKFGKPVSRTAMMNAMYFDKVGDEPDGKIIDIRIHRIRNKLKGSDFEIETIWGEGFRLKSKQEQA